MDSSETQYHQPKVQAGEMQLKPGSSGCKNFAFLHSRTLPPRVRTLQCVRSIPTYRCPIIFILLVIKEDVSPVTTQNDV